MWPPPQSSKGLVLNGSIFFSLLQIVAPLFILEVMAAPMFFFHIVAAPLVDLFVVAQEILAH